VETKFPHDSVTYLTQEAELKEIRWIPDVGLGLEAFRNMKGLHEQYCRRHLKSLRKEDFMELSMSHNATGNSC
jgi:hypothetical protein